MQPSKRESRTAWASDGAIQNLIDPPPAALTLFETPGQAPEWRIDAYYDEPPAPEALREGLASRVALLRDALA